VPSTKRYFRKESRQTSDLRGGQGWQQIRVWRTIRHPIYKGLTVRRVGGQEIDNHLPFALVEPALWQAANDALDQPRRRRADPRAAPFYLLAGMIRCLGCAAWTVTGRPRVYSGYAARRRKRSISAGPPTVLAG
jgi:hypothetical protein